MSDAHGAQPEAAARELVDIDRSGSPVVRIHAQPGAARPGLAGRHGDALKVRVTARPVDGRANAAVAEALAAAFELPVASVELVSGASSRRKRFRLSGADPEAVIRTLSSIVRG